MKKIFSFNSKIDAELAVQFLISNEIHAEWRGARDYASHITGSDMGRYELLVDDAHFEKAFKLLNQNNTLAVSEPAQEEFGYHLKRAIVFALIAGFLLPLVFNFFSLKHLFYYLKLESNLFRKVFYTLLILVLQLPAGLLFFFRLSDLIKS